jgi:hypothetical protein
MSVNTLSTFDYNVDKTLDLHGLFHKFCHNLNENNILIDSRYFKMLVKHNMPMTLIQDYLCNVVEKTLTTNTHYVIHANLESISVFDFNKYQTFILNITSVFRARFANRLGKCNLHNTSILFKIMHGFLKKFLSKEDLDCVIFVKEES